MNIQLENATLEFDAVLSEFAAEGVRLAMAAIRGVERVELAPDCAAALVAFDPCVVKPQQLRLAARALGHGVRRIVLPGTDALVQEVEPRARLLVADPGPPRTVHWPIPGPD